MNISNSVPQQHVFEILGEAASSVPAKSLNSFPILANQQF